MAAAEAAVVVDLRALFCPGGIFFPMLDLGADAGTLRIGIVELVREAATLLMLISAGVLAGSTFWQRWAFFLIGFGLWDLLYYVWLFVFLGWPPSLMSWDVLFLIPVAWTGPVIAPCLVAAALVASGAAILHLEPRGGMEAFCGLDWALEVVAGLTIILAFAANTQNCQSLSEEELRFPWILFGTGLALGLGVFAGALRRGLRR